MPAPGGPETAKPVEWTTAEAVKWKLDCLWGRREPPDVKNERLFRFKDAWTEFHRNTIIETAQQNDLDVDLVAGVAWIEVGGDPKFFDTAAYEVRSVFDNLHEALPEPSSWFDWSRKRKPPSRTALKTSFGSVSMQLTTAMRAIGISPESASTSQIQMVTRLLENDEQNIRLAGKHLAELKRFDFSGKKVLTEFEIVVVASRYNRGTARPLADFKASFEALPGAENRKFTEYGRALWQRRNRLRKLLRLALSSEVGSAHSDKHAHPLSNFKKPPSAPPSTPIRPAP